MDLETVSGYQDINNVVYERYFTVECIIMITSCTVFQCFVSCVFACVFVCSVCIWKQFQYTTIRIQTMYKRFDTNS